MSVTVKLFFERTDGSVETRRFPINTTGGDFFASTKEKIKQMYTGLTNSKFTLYWKDPDEDLITFSTLEEMKCGLTYATDGVFRVYVYEDVETLEGAEAQDQESSGSQLTEEVETLERPEPQNQESLDQSQPQGSNQSQPQQPQPGSGHTDEPGHRCTWCNACQNQVKGNCCKCCVCPDCVCPGIKSCQMCKGKEVHTEHVVYKITHPHHFCRLPPCLCHPVFSHHSGQHPVFIHHGFGAPGAHAGASACFSSSTGPIPCPFGGLLPPVPPYPGFTHHPPLFSVPGAPYASASFSSSTGPIPGPFGGFPPGHPHPVFIHPPGFSVPGDPDASASFSSSNGPIPGVFGGFPPVYPPGLSASGAHAGASASLSSSTGPIPGPSGQFQPVYPPGFSVPGAPGAGASFSNSFGPNPGMFGGANFSGSCGVNPGGTSFGGSCGVNPGGTSFGGSCGVNPDGTSFGGSFGSNPGMSGGANFHTGTNTDQKDKNGQPSADGPFNQNGLNISALLDQIFSGINTIFDTHAGTRAPQQESNQFTWPPVGGGFTSWEDLFCRFRRNNTTESAQAGAASKDSKTSGGRRRKNAPGNVPKDAGVKVTAEKRSSDQTNDPKDGCEFHIPSSAPIPLPGPTSDPEPTSNPAPTSDPAPTTSSPSAEHTQPAPAAASQNSDQSTASTGTQSTARPQANLYPNQQVPQSLEEMMSMCSSLLTENDGNLGATVDAIMAAAEQLGNLHGGR